MAKETMIVFVYDTEYCQNEADDPVQAVLYFHPSWVSDTQKLSLCGQLMGTTYFLKECFFKPKIIALQNGKFILKEFGRFILAVGTDRNLSDSLLEHRAELLTSLLKFFHRDVQTIYDQFLTSSLSISNTEASSSITSSNNNTGQYKNLSDKLYHIFETYLPILQYNGNIFQNIPKLRLPKSASNIFLDAIQTLQSCQQIKGVLGGTILYHNKVVATQLSPEITKNLLLTDPFHIKSTAEPILVDFHIPIGVQMLIVYISINDYKKLQYDAQKAQNIVTQNFSLNGYNNGIGGNNNGSLLPFQFQIKRKMKRDKSLIFTNIPEEVGHNESVTVTPAATAVATTITESEIKTKTVDNSNEIKTNTITDISKLPSKSNNNVSRPNHLPLKFKNVTSKDIPESGFVSINFDESDSYAEFIGRTSVCSTPMTENKILQYDNIMSICANPTQDNLILNEKSTKNNNNSKKIFKKNSIEEEKEEGERKETENNDELKGIKKFNNYLSKIDFDKFFTNFITNPNKKFERRNSLNDLQDSIKKFSKRFTITKSSTSSSSSSILATKQSSYNNTNNINNNNNENENQKISNGSDGGGLTTPDFVDDVIDSNDNGKKKKKKYFRTISDPMYPVFNSDGEPISKSLFQEFLDKYHKTWNNDETKQLKAITQTAITTNHKEIDNKNSAKENSNNTNNDEDYYDDDDDDEKFRKLVEEFKEFDNELNKFSEELTKTEIVSSPTTTTVAAIDTKKDNGTILNTQENNTSEKTPDNLKEIILENAKQVPSLPSQQLPQPNRKSLSLPIKPLNDVSLEKENYQFQNNGNGTIINNSNSIFERKKHSGIQLTPLMAKLSILALNEERSSGFCSWDTTPGIDLPTPIDITATTNKIYRRRSSTRNEDVTENNLLTPIATINGNEFQKVELYICGQQNMTFLLLLEEGSSQKQELIQAMFDTCILKLTKLETQLNQTLNVNVDGDKSEGGYSYICVDPKWDTLQRGGPWSIMDMDSLEHIHKDLNLQYPITDLILRTDDSVLYGYKCGLTEYFYKQSAQSQSGLPPPADMMGTISMRAKRRLERDHSLILF